MPGAFFGILIFVIFIAIFIIVVRNSLVAARNNVRNAWSQIDVELQRRFDLIPNLVETVKGYMAHEEAVLTKVTELRSAWGNASSVSEKAKLESDLSGAVKSIYAVAEQYPELKSNSNFISLQEELSNTESKIAASRSSYNSIVTTYNTKLEVFPSNIVAGMFSFKKEDLFEVENEEIRKNVKVSF